MTASSVPPRDDLDRERRWMAGVRAGDRAAFRALYDRYAPGLMRFVFRLCQDRELAEDLVQESFLALWRAAPRWQDEGRVGTYLFQVAKRRWWKRRRRASMRRVREAAAARGRPRDVAGAPDRPLVLAEEGERLAQALALLSPRLRLAFVLVRLENLPYAEAARIAGVPVGTLKSRMVAAEARLRLLLAPSS